MAITPVDFDFVSKLIHERAAIVLEPGKEYLVESRLAPLARREGFESIGDLIRKLRGERFGKMTEDVVEAMTTNETLFFRDNHPFDALQKTILPRLIEERRKERTLNFWCAASASGQEPFSVCMIIREHFPELLNWKINFHVSDISPGMLDRCRDGSYSQLEVNRGLPAKLLVKYFKKEGAVWQIRPEIREMLSLQQVNLAGHWPTFPKLDVVFIRNVLIYFDVPTKQRILGKIRNLLRPGGVMFLGGSETTINLDAAFTRTKADATWVYQLAS